MKLKLITFLCLVINHSAFCQTNKVTNDILEVKENNIYKIYLNDNLGPARRLCATFYMECKINPDSFVFEDTLKVFYFDKKIYTKGKYVNGQKTGKFVWYHKNGKVSLEGNYDNDVRTGIWKYYYEDGSLRKTVQYGDSIMLLDFFSKKGKQLVKDGNGHYDDELSLYGVNAVKTRLEGDMVDGAFDGEWKWYTDGKLIGTEKFRNKQFVGGVSYTALGSRPYNNEFYSTFLDLVPSEDINFRGIQDKCDLVGYTINVEKRNDFDAILKSSYSQTLSSEYPADYWFFAVLDIGSKDNLKGVAIYTLKDGIDKQKLMDFITNSFQKSNKVNLFKDYKMFIPIVIKDHKLYLKGDSEIPMLR